MAVDMPEDNSSVMIKQRELYSAAHFFKGYGRKVNHPFGGIHTAAWKHFAGTGRSISRPLWLSGNIRVHTWFPSRMSYCYTKMKDQGIFCVLWVLPRICSQSLYIWKSCTIYDIPNSKSIELQGIVFIKPIKHRICLDLSFLYSNMTVYMIEWKHRHRSSRRNSHLTVKSSDRLAHCLAHLAPPPCRRAVPRLQCARSVECSTCWSIYIYIYVRLIINADVRRYLWEGEKDWWHVCLVLLVIFLLISTSRQDKNIILLLYKISSDIYIGNNIDVRHGWWMQDMAYNSFCHQRVDNRRSRLARERIYTYALSCLCMYSLCDKA